MEKCTFAAISCAHQPDACEESLTWALATLEDLSPRPDVFIDLGDAFDSSAASVHPDAPDTPLSVEYRAAAMTKKAFRGVLPANCRLVWMLGNHEDNITRPDRRRIDKRLHGLVHWNKSDYKDEFRKWHQIPYRKAPECTFQLGQVIFTHGFDIGVTSDDLEALQFSYMCGGRAHRLVVRGHTHHPSAVTQCHRTRTVPLPYWFANAGTLGPLQPRYMTRKSAFRWGPAIVYGEAVLRPNYNQGGRQWTAATLTPQGAI